MMILRMLHSNSCTSDSLLFTSESIEEGDVSDVKKRTAMMMIMTILSQWVWSKKRIAPILTQNHPFQVQIGYYITLPYCQVPL